MDIDPAKIISLVFGGDIEIGENRLGQGGHKASLKRSCRITGWTAPGGQIENARIGQTHLAGS